MEQNWYNKIVNLKYNTGTTAVMEWIRDHKCPNLDCTIFKGLCLSLIVTYQGNVCPSDSMQECFDNGVYVWHEYEGMKRFGNAQQGWWFVINDEWYFCTISRC